MVKRISKKTFPFFHLTASLRKTVDLTQCPGSGFYPLNRHGVGGIGTQCCTTPVEYNIPQSWQFRNYNFSPDSLHICNAMMHAIQCCTQCNVTHNAMLYAMQSFTQCNVARNEVLHAMQCCM